MSEYEKDFMNIKHYEDKTLRLHNMTIVVRSVFEEYGKFYPQIYLDEYLYKL